MALGVVAAWSGCAADSSGAGGGAIGVVKQANVGDACQHIGSTFGSWTCPAGSYPDEDGDNDTDTFACCFAGGAHTCRNLSADENNCGSCGHHCTTGQTCCDGVCKGQADYADDNANCGSCGNLCPTDLGYSCDGAGQCRANCSDTQADREKCGGFGMICALTQDTAFHCVENSVGGCTVQADCTHADVAHTNETMLCCTTGICKYAGGADPDNCGSCGNACPSGYYCCTHNGVVQCEASGLSCDFSKDYNQQP